MAIGNERDHLRGRLLVKGDEAHFALVDADFVFQSRTQAILVSAQCYDADWATQVSRCYRELQYRMHHAILLPPTREQ